MHGEIAKWIDMLSLSVVLATLMQILPAVAALFTVIWTILRSLEAYENWKAARRANKRSE